MAASPKPKQSQLPKTNPPNRTLADAFAIARAWGDFRQKQAKALTPADADAHGRHNVVRGQIREVFQESCSDAEEKIAATPLRKKYPVFEAELIDLRNELGEVLREACEAYTNLAIIHRSEIGSDPLGWVQDHINADLSGMYDRLAQWVQEAVGLGASLELPAWIDYHELRRALGRRPSDIELAEALPDATGALITIWTHFRTALETTKGAMIQAAREKLAALPTSKHRIRTVRKTTVDQFREEKIIREILPRGFKGPAYCRAVDGLSVPMPRHLTDSGCPKTYVEAYRIPKWRKAIQDEKCRLTKIREETRHSSQASTASKN